MDDVPARSAARLRLFARGGVMGRMIAEYDWAGSPLGPISYWSSALLHTVATMLPASVETVLFWGPEYVALYNDAYAPTIGDKHPRALGRPAREAWAELWDDLEPLLRHVRDTGETFAARDRPFYIERHGYGEEVFFDISYSPVPEDDGSVGGVLCIVTETTARVRALRDVAAESERLRESEARFRNLADSLPALIWLTNEGGEIEFANAYFESMLGFTPAEMIEGGWQIAFRPEDRAFVRERARARSANPAPGGGEFCVVAKDGTERWIHGEIRPRYAAGLFRGYVACAIDVSEAHRVGQQLEQRVEERTAELTQQIAERERVEATLHQMQRLEAIGQLTSGVAHDFNNLLTVVLGNVDMLVHAAAKGPLDGRALKRLEHVRTAAERGATLTAQLLAFSRRQRLEAKVVDLNETVGGLTDLLGSTLGRSITIETRPEPNLWPAMVDPTQIELIILNLAINARDAMSGGGTLTVATTNVTCGPPERPEEPAPGDYVRVAVSDTGTGMSPDVLARAFEPFFTTKEIGKGSGLGLAQVYGFAKQSGGGVRIDTVEGQGTTVNVFLPRADSMSEPDAAVMPAPAPTAPIAGRTVLVLDDEDPVREVTAETLREAGCRVVEAADGAAALHALDHEPDICAVVADFAMPRMNGAAFAELAEAQRPGLPILFVTGYADIDAIATVPEERLIRKPFAREAVVERLRVLLDGR
jgi:PAS domain S-box-containing protein